jgi:tryptophan-rich sensory protein
MPPPLALPKNQQTDKGGRGLPITLYLTQLALNLAWTPLFFQKHWADAALVDSAGEGLVVWSFVKKGANERLIAAII